MPRKHILVVEDEPDIANLLEYNLVREGYQVSLATDGEEGLGRIVEDHPDLVLLDLMLPGLDGLEICRRVKQDEATRDVSIIMVTAKGDEADIVLGLGLGADDYVAKPFSPREVLARVKAVLRRLDQANAPSSSGRIALDGVVIDSERHQVLVDEDPVEFTATQFRLLHVLASAAGRVFTRDQLMSRVIAGDAHVTDRNIDVHVRAVRNKLGAHRDLIETIRGVGYRFRSG